MTNSFEEFIENELSKVRCDLDDYSVSGYNLNNFSCANCNSKKLIFFGLVINNGKLDEAYHDGVCSNCGNKLRVYLRTIIDFKDLSDEED